MKITDLKTTILGFIGGTTFTTGVAALADENVQNALSNAGVSPIALIIIGAVVKIFRDYFSKDKESVQK